MWPNYVSLLFWILSIIYSSSFFSTYIFDSFISNFLQSETPSIFWACYRTAHMDKKKLVTSSDRYTQKLKECVRTVIDARIQRRTVENDVRWTSYGTQLLLSRRIIASLAVCLSVCLSVTRRCSAQPSRTHNDLSDHPLGPLLLSFTLSVSFYPRLSLFMRVSIKPGFHSNAIGYVACVA